MIPPSPCGLTLDTYLLERHLFGNMAVPKVSDVESKSQLSLFAQSPALTNVEVKPMTVSELTTRIKGLLENEVGHVWVRGEISNFKPSPSGHSYFSLKDGGATLSCALFRARSSSGGSSLRFTPKDGLEVLVKGKISVYSPRGSYQLIVDSIEPLGHGALQLAFEELKNKLKGEGLFELSRKKSIPSFPTRIVLITSPTGAVLQDMLNVLGRRNAGISLLLLPTLVQGNDAPLKIVEAIGIANKYNLGDIIVVARGGGSLEDLWCFNDERVVRAVAASRIPTISAIGHEVDYTLCDFVADLRAPTPSAAAELVSKNRLELLETLEQFMGRLRAAAYNSVSRMRQKVLGLEKLLVSPSDRVVRMGRELNELDLKLFHLMEGRIPERKQQIDELYVTLCHSLEKRLMGSRHQLESLSSQLEAISPLKVLGRGYTLVQAEQDGTFMKSCKDAKPGKKVSLIFYDGKARAEILSS